MSIRAGCLDAPCKPWTPPPDCCNACVTPSDHELFDLWWCAVVDWLFVETGCRYTGHCPVETQPCPPCGCRCNSDCSCGPWDSFDLGKAFCYPICVTDGVPCLEFVLPTIPGEPDVVLGPDSGVWTLRPDLLTVDWCQPFGNSCGSLYPAQDYCDDPWSIRATIGEEPPKMLLLGAAQFVCEIVKSCTGKDNCLPDGVTSITRRDISVEVGPQLSETINFENQGTGIPLLDAALRQWGSDRETKPFIMFDPLARRDEFTRQEWSFRGVLNPTPPSCYVP